MGQYLVIGIAATIGVNKQRVKEDFNGIENYKSVMEKEFNQRGIYQWSETETQVFLELKPEIAEQEWMDFIKSFYELRYMDEERIGYRIDKTLEDIAVGHDLRSWLEIARENCHQCYHMLPLYCYPIKNPYSFRGWTYVGMDMVVLSLDGKIIMECYSGLFRSLVKIIREKLERFSLSDSLFMDISD